MSVDCLELRLERKQQLQGVLPQLGFAPMSKNTIHGPKTRGDISLQICVSHYLYRVFTRTMGNKVPGFCPTGIPHWPKTLLDGLGELWGSRVPNSAPCILSNTCKIPAGKRRVGGSVGAARFCTTSSPSRRQVHPPLAAFQSPKVGEPAGGQI